MIRAEPLRMTLGIAALTFYLWIIHSYKLNAGDVAVIALGVGVLVRGGQLRIPGQLIVFGLFIFWGAVGLAVTASVAISTEALIDLIKLWIISFLVINVVRTPAELRYMTIAYLAVFALYPVRGALYNQFICHCTELGRVAWNFVFKNPNDLAALSLLPMGAAAGVASVERVKIYRYAGMIGVGVLALIIMLTQSRGAMLALGVAVIMLPLSSRKRTRDLLLIGLVMGGAAIFAPKDVWNRLAGLSNVSVDEGMAGVDPEGSAKARWEIWRIAGDQFKAHPITGVGIGVMPEVNRRVALQEGLDWEVRGPRDTHSTYLRIAAEMGVPGLLLYLVMWGFVIAKLKKAKAATKHVRPREFQFMTFIELSVFAFLAASVFGTYGSLSFTYMMLSFVWLASDTLERHPWYVPAGSPELAAAPAPGNPVRTRRSRTV